MSDRDIWTTEQPNRFRACVDRVCHRIEKPMTVFGALGHKADRLRFVDCCVANLCGGRLVFSGVADATCHQRTIRGQDWYLVGYGIELIIPAAILYMLGFEIYERLRP